MAGIIRIGEQWQRDCFATLNMTRFHVSLRASVTSVAINRQRIPRFCHSEAAFAAEKSQNTRVHKNVSFCPATSGDTTSVVLTHDSIRAAEITNPTSLRGESSPHSISLPLFIAFCPNLWYNRMSLSNAKYLKAHKSRLYRLQLTNQEPFDDFISYGRKS